VTSREKEWWELVNPYRVAVAPSLETVSDFVAGVVCGDPALINHCLWEARQDPVILYALFEQLAVVPTPSGECKSAFHSAWITQGLWIRDEFSIDPLLPAALANLLPGYSGSSIELFRGERWSNHKTGAYGPSWSTERSVAATFASGLNRCPVTGGVILRTVAAANAILAGPTPGNHMQSEAEYIVDRRLLGNVEVVERFPPD
jgi:hypothetical protein